VFYLKLDSSNAICFFVNIEAVWCSLNTYPARKNTARLFKNLTTTYTHEFIQLFL